MWDWERGRCDGVGEGVERGCKGEEGGQDLGVEEESAGGMVGRDDCEMEGVVSEARESVHVSMCPD